MSFYSLKAGIGIFTFGAVMATVLASCTKKPTGGKTKNTQSSESQIVSKNWSVEFLDQGWSEKDRDWFYNTSQGSQFLPYDWFLALESDASDTLLRSDESMARAGYLPSPVTKLNPDGLPVGFVKDIDKARGSFVGLTCAACHTGNLHFGGKKVQIDGGVGMGDVMKLFELAQASLASTLADPVRFERFVGRLNKLNTGKVDSQALRKSLSDSEREFVQFLERNKPSSPAGRSRVPHFGLLVNEATGTALGIKENRITTDAFTTMPMLWGFTELDWVGANASVNNPIARMCLEAMGVKAHFKLSDPTTMTFESSFRYSEMHEMHLASSKLKPPRWKEEVFGIIDRPMAALGEKIYSAQCEECHSREPNHPKTPPNSFGKSYIKVKIVDLAEIGTDPVLVEEMLSVKSRTSFLKPFFQGQDEVLALEMTRVAISSHLKNEFSRLALSQDKIAEYTGHRDPGAQPNLRSYKARPLEGIWSTGPYLHNGSVPTLAQLLKKPQDRVREFWIGSYEFDANDVGVSTVPSPLSTKIDTSRKGNGNMGHIYGTDLPEVEKRSLLEFLKTL